MAKKKKRRKIPTKRIWSQRIHYLRFGGYKTKAAALARERAEKVIASQIGFDVHTRKRKGKFYVYREIEP